jgi:hypothetical protein
MNEMNQNIADLLSIIELYSNRFEQISGNDFSAKPNPVKWSKQEVLGHLVDSAHNNLRRFIVTQYETSPPKITYDQDFWVSANDYQSMPKADLIQLWKLLNYRIAAVWKNLNTDQQLKQADTGKNEVSLRTIAWLAADYNKHMKHHINQIIPDSFDVIYK